MTQWSMCGFLSLQVYNIQYPAAYTETMDWFDSINLPIDILPFGCVFPTLDNYIFYFVLRTATPLALVIALMLGSRALRLRHKVSALADTCADLVRREHDRPRAPTSPAAYACCKHAPPQPARASPADAW